MKPDKNVCLNCGKEISQRAKYCSDRCTKAYKRNSDKKGPEVGQNSDIPQLGQVKSDMTETDQTFYDRAMKDFGEPYYKFGESEREETCLQCDKKFKTTLSMLRFCSYKHYSDALAGRK